jgi:hypothetical protein
MVAAISHQGAEGKMAIDYFREISETNLNLENLSSMSYEDICDRNKNSII